MPDIRTIDTDRAPGAIGPYSQAIVASGVVYTAGQIPLDPRSGEMVGQGDVAKQAEQVLANLRGVLEAAGAGLETVLRTTVYLADMNDFAAMNEVYARYFSDHKPARSTVQAARLPKDARVEIDAIAAIR